MDRFLDPTCSPVRTALCVPEPDSAYAESAERSGYGEVFRGYCLKWSLRFAIMMLSNLWALGLAFGQTYDYQAEFAALSAEIEKHANQPPPKSDVGEYLQEMDRKAQQREKADLFNGAALADGSPLAEEFKALSERAQMLGDSVANKGAIEHMNFWPDRRRIGPFLLQGDQWEVIIERLRENGRPLRTRAEKHGFSLSLIMDRAICMVRYAVGDIEVGHMGLYDGRDKVLADMDADGMLRIPDRDFDTNCALRIEFIQQEKGCPLYPTKKGLKEAKKVRDEAEWWGFSNSEREMTELIEEFFRDTLCINPLSCLAKSKIPSGKGLEHYAVLAKKFDLPKAEDLVDDFYGTLHGKVEIFSKDGREPASGAEVTNRSPKDEKEWGTTADEQGKYEIEDVPLHKYCGPYEVEAKHEKGSDFREYEGPLEEPSANHRHQEDLEIVVAEGVLEYHEKFFSRSHCTVEDTSDLLTFRLIPTRDPCVYNIEGGSTSPVHTRKRTCEEPTGPPSCPGHRMTWHHLERQMRITGGVVDFRDSRTGSFRPITEVRNDYTRCESLRVDCYGEETRHQSVCHASVDGARLGHDNVSKDGWMKSGTPKMEMKDGQKSRHYGKVGWGLNYILHIDEKPFRKLEQRCEEFNNSGKVLDTEISEGALATMGSQLIVPDSDRNIPSKTARTGPLQTRLDRLLPKQIPRNWSERHVFEAEAAGYASRFYFKEQESLEFILVDHEKSWKAESSWQSILTRGNFETGLIAGHRTLKESGQVKILVDHFILSLKGAEALVGEWLPLLRLDSVSDEQIAPEVGGKPVLHPRHAPHAKPIGVPHATNVEHREPTGRPTEEPNRYIGGVEKKQRTDAALTTEVHTPDQSLDKQKLRHAQCILNEIGFNVGTADGFWGRRTARAVRAFQSWYPREKLPVTGRLDDRTYVALQAAAESGLKRHTATPSTSSSSQVRKESQPADVSRRPSSREKARDPRDEMIRKSIDSIRGVLGM